jgi:nicotinate-nucleotide pyrophosphorylase
MEAVFLRGDVVLEVSGEAKHLLKIRTGLAEFSFSAFWNRHSYKQMRKKRFRIRFFFALRVKTLWGPIDKKGVAVGGGGTHRLGLFDAVLVKENHLSLLAEWHF